MKLIIFAGGIGTRLWPLSRRNSPKQFDKVFDGKSTIQLAVERVAPDFGYQNIYIQTSSTNFKKQILQQLPQINSKNIIIEPARRNLGPAVCLAAHKLLKQNYNGPIAILWADHLMNKVNEFISALKTGEKLISQDPYRFIFMAEKPRFANNNLGWINVGRKIGAINKKSYFKFLGWKYKPSQKECNKMFISKKYYWNPGYFITSTNFLIEQYKKLAPQIFKSVSTGNYKRAKAESFDKAIVERINHSSAVILKTNLEWSDPGTLYALKEALAKVKKDNVVLGNVYNLESKDCLVYNLENKKLVTTVGLAGMVIVNTQDALIVVPKDKVKQVTELTYQLEQHGLRKYL